MPLLVKSCCAGIPQRWIFVFLGFLGVVSAYGIRISLSITLTQMVTPLESDNNNTTTNNNNNNLTLRDYANTPSSSNSTAFKGGTFDWSESTQGMVLSSFYWGYVIFQIPAGILAEKFGGKYTFGLGILLTAILHVLSPYAIWWGGLTAFVSVRFAMGLASGVLYPAGNVLLSHWIPLEERSRAGVFVFSGAFLGTVFATSVSGVILEYSSIGWPAVFYFFGAVGVVWSAIFFAFVYDTPLEHPYISDEEVKFLNEKLSKHKHLKPPPTPWKYMLTSKPVWALIVASVGNGWGVMTLMNDLNKYMSDVLKFSIKDNGYMSSLPYLAMYLVSIGYSIVSDWLIGSNRMSTTNVRKLGITVASIGPATFLIGASYAGMNKTVVMTMITIGASFFGFAIGSVKVNVLDLSPNYAGTLMAFKNDFAAATGFFTPMVVGFLTPHQTVEEWRVVFWIIFAVLLLTNVVHLLYASGEVQEWNDPEFLKRNRTGNKPTKEELQLLSISDGKPKNNVGDADNNDGCGCCSGDKTATTR